MIEEQKNSGILIEEFCRKHWSNSSVRRYYIERCRKKKEYGRALETLDESMVLDNAYRGLIEEYSNQKKRFTRKHTESSYGSWYWKMLRESCLSTEN